MGIYLHVLSVLVVQIESCNVDRNTLNPYAYESMLLLSVESFYVLNQV